MPLASTRQGAGVRLAYPGRDKCSRLSSGLGKQFQGVLRVQPWAGTPDGNCCPKPRAARRACPGVPEPALGLTLNKRWLGAQTATQPLEASAKRWGDPRLSPRGPPTAGRQRAPLGSDTPGFKRGPALGIRGPWQVPHPPEPHKLDTDVTAAAEGSLGGPERRPAVRDVTTGGTECLPDTGQRAGHWWRGAGSGQPSLNKCSSVPSDHVELLTPVPKDTPRGVPSPGPGSHQCLQRGSVPRDCGLPRRLRVAFPDPHDRRPTLSSARCRCSAGPRAAYGVHSSPTAGLNGWAPPSNTLSPAGLQ